MRLSRTGWNNVIIFAMLLMIFLFNGLHHKLLKSDESQAVQAIFPVQSFVLTMAYPELKIERIGTTWRATDLMKLNEQSHQPEQLAQLVLNWQQTHAQLVSDVSPLQSALKLNGARSAVTVWFAGQAQASVFQLVIVEQHFYLLDQHQQRWFILEPALVAQLFPFMSL